MSDRKSHNHEIKENRQIVILQNRRVDEVRKNFAIGSKGIISAKNISRESRLRTRAKN